VSCLLCAGLASVAANKAQATTYTAPDRHTPSGVQNGITGSYSLVFSFIILAFLCLHPLLNFKLQAYNITIRQPEMSRMAVGREYVTLFFSRHAQHRALESQTDTVALLAKTSPADKKSARLGATQATKKSLTEVQQTLHPSKEVASARNLGNPSSTEGNSRQDLQDCYDAMSRLESLHVYALSRKDENFFLTWSRKLHRASLNPKTAIATLEAACSAFEMVGITVRYFRVVHVSSATISEISKASKSSVASAEHGIVATRADGNGLPAAFRLFLQGSKARLIREPSLPARLNGKEISAFPDLGAPANFIALHLVQSYGFAIKPAVRQVVSTSIGSAISIMGTVTLPFSFEGEDKSYQLEFNVISEAIHNVIVGSPFLSLTRTFTRHAHRLKQKFRKVLLPRMCFLGSHQYVSGRVNGIYVEAVPDTGADVPLMSKSFAKYNGLVIHTGPEHRVLLEFADGSTATTIGLVKGVEWRFWTSKEPYHLDVYVIEKLQTKFILDNTFLYNTNAFVAHELDFWTDNSETHADNRMISIIKLVDTVMKGSRSKKSGIFPDSHVRPVELALTFVPSNPSSRHHRKLR
jgi:hypothetical protein